MRYGRTINVTMDKNQSCIRVLADEVQIQQCKENLEENKESFGKLSSILNLAGNEVRLKILYLLEQEGQLCPCDLSDILGMSIPAISQHIRKMKDRNIITGKRSGQTIFYAINEEHLELLKPLFQEITVGDKKEMI
ncbi:DNA-binding transcriptional regulator, ArsR family [Marivirga sericea]|uniref:DNA-binding transcriptional regulator, ArsR family n=2 Tax=Marivirga TaxID=869806 RepID=A0A1X7K2A6_9BACT|nr:DNA-binding transcriptional regulator, ArsR family [Marivirga sericea]